jgi:hypothetical protein
VKITNNILECDLRNKKGNWVYNRLEINDLLLNKYLVNDNGVFRYRLTKEDDAHVMRGLFPVYRGNKLDTISIDKCYMLSVNIPKYNNIRNGTLALLKNYKLPPVEVFFGYTDKTAKNAPFYDLLENKNQRNELTMGMFAIFNDFVNKKETGWMLYLEDDVRLINLPVGEDLTVLHNVPEDAEIIRPYIGKNEQCDIKNINYCVSYGGGLNHAFYISVVGCKKVLNYAKKYKWKYNCDIDIYKLAKQCKEYPTGLDGWSLRSSENKNDITRLLNEDEKIYMYHMSHIVFNQTSLPCI